MNPAENRLVARREHQRPPTENFRRVKAEVNLGLSRQVGEIPWASVPEDIPSKVRSDSQGHQHHCRLLLELGVLLPRVIP